MRSICSPHGCGCSLSAGFLFIQELAIGKETSVVDYVIVVELHTMPLKCILDVLLCATREKKKRRLNKSSP